jgi:hypothetical protein
MPYLHQLATMAFCDLAFFWLMLPHCLAAFPAVARAFVFRQHYFAWRQEMVALANWASAAAIWLAFLLHKKAFSHFLKFFFIFFKLLINSQPIYPIFTIFCEVGAGRKRGTLAGHPTAPPCGDPTPGVDGRPPVDLVRIRLHGNVYVEKF